MYKLTLFKTCSGTFLNPGSEIRIRDGKKIRIWDEHPRSFFQELRKFLGLKILKLFYEDPDPESFGPGSGINIPDPQHRYDAY
jgi:hypothetical protein